MYEIFEKLLAEKGLTVYRIAKDTGLNAAMFTSWKKGAYTPKQDKLQKIADYFGVSLEYLITGKESDKPVPDDKYYINPDAAQLAQEIFDNPELRMLFDAAKDSKPEDLQMAADMLKRFKESNPDG